MDSRKLLLSIVNPHITCYICKGYFDNATTVIDCLHTFCKSCLLKHFIEKDNCCPKCETLVHQSHPSHYASFDRTLQDIVYKLVPNLQTDERNRRILFNDANGIIEDENDSDEPQQKVNGCSNSNQDMHRDDEQVSMFLTADENPIKKLKRKYISCSSQATIVHVKKYLAKKLFFDVNKFVDIDILCNDELMGKDHSLKFVQLTRWRTKSESEPMELVYRKHIDF